MNIMRIKLLADLGKYKKDQVVKIDCDKHGMPMDQFWRRRLNELNYEKYLQILAEDKKLNHNKLKVEKVNKKSK